jgi:predicted acyltransferase
MLAIGIVGVVVGEAWNPWFPINKKLWTSSYVILTAGLALVCLAACLWILDIKGWRRGTTPFLVFGSNAIAGYFFAEVIAHALWRIPFPGAGGMPTQAVLYERLIMPLASPPVASLLYALVFVAFCWVAMWILYRRGIFIKI